MEIIKERENPLLRRREVIFKIKHEGGTPQRGEVRKLLVKRFRAKENVVVIDKMETEFGKKETVGYAKIYEDEGRLKEIERVHKIRRNFGDVGA
ncbi:MAG: 30S ribosomal protein S24e [Candidatus Methanospirareceae archaeon]